MAKFCVLCGETTTRNNAKYCLTHKVQVRQDQDRKRKSGENAESRRQYQNSLIVKNRIRVYEYLLNNPCIDCGESDPVVLEFDHRDPSTKHRAISKMLGGTTSWAKIQEEINKCDVRCANCHRRRTATQFDWYSTLNQASVSPPASIRSLTA